MGICTCEAAEQKEAPRQPEEAVEGRPVTKENHMESNTRSTQSEERVSQGLRGVREKAKGNKQERFTALLHHVTVELLTEGYLALKRNASPGIDGMTWKEYEEGLKERIIELHSRVHRGAYRVKPAKRAWIPKANGEKRPLGIAALEDKIVQQAVRKVLEAIYEEDFRGFSYGFRPSRSQHDALDAVYVAIRGRNVNWVLDIDIRGFFDHIDHEWMMKFIEYRIADLRVLRLLRKWLKAGVIEEGEWHETEEGSPQGSVISPLLSNIYLHYVLDQWTDQWRQTATGVVTIVRYADDAIIGFQHQAEAERYLRELREQLRKHGLELNETKTKLNEFGRHAENDRQQRGEGKPETFTFLGMQHVCSQNRRGSYEIRRITDGKRRRKKLLEIKQQLRLRMHESVASVGQWLRSVLTGYYNYHAVTGNIDVLSRFRHKVARLWHQALGRRSQQRPNWEQTGPIFAYWLPTPKVKHPYPDARFRARHPRVPYPR